MSAWERQLRRPLEVSRIETARDRCYVALMIDLNNATTADLDTVPQLRGHGFEIVRYREERGRFESLRQLDEVPGLAGKWDGAEAEVEIG